MSLALQATALGLVCHQMAGIDGAKIVEIFGVPDGVEPVTAIAVGWPGDPDALPEAMREAERAPRTRLPQGDVVFAGGWGKPATLD